MKQEWKPEEMRANAEKIRTAIMPKSITPEMVGGTMVGLVNAVGEVVEILGEIPREHVKVKVRGYNETGELKELNGAVYVDMWCSGGFPCTSVPRRALQINAEGEAEFDVPHGYKYALFSKADGLGASFQWVFEATQDLRQIELWNQPVGIYAQWLIGFCNDEAGEYPYFPAVTHDGSERPTAGSEAVISPAADGYYPDEVLLLGVLVSTAETSFVIPENDRGGSVSPDGLTWASGNYHACLVPNLPAINNKDGEYQSSAVIRSQSDMDGNMNTAKISDFFKRAPAADWAVDSRNFEYEQRWLPSAGQLRLMYLNRSVIDKILKELGKDEILLSIGGPTYWSSTQFDEYSSFTARMAGTGYAGRDETKDVRSVSAFIFDV